MKKSESLAAGQPTKKKKKPSSKPLAKDASLVPRLPEHEGDVSHLMVKENLRPEVGALVKRIVQKNRRNGTDAFTHK